MSCPKCDDLGEVCISCGLAGDDCNNSGCDSPSFVKCSCYEAKSVRNAASVGWFSKEMLKKLEANNYKSGWDSCSVGWLMSRLNNEIGEIEQALLSGDAKQIVEECADVANFAMMIADISKPRIAWVLDTSCAIWLAVYGSVVVGKVWEAGVGDSAFPDANWVSGFNGDTKYHRSVKDAKQWVEKIYIAENNRGS